MFNEIFYHLIGRIYKKLQKQKNKWATAYFISATGTLSPRSIKHPCYIVGGQFMQIGKGFQSGPGLRIEALNKYDSETFQPQIIIGKNVSCGSNCHLGTINRIEIHDNVLIASNVFITDHQHGNLIPKEREILAINRPLYSKGPVVIEQNVWVGENVAIMPGVRIGANSIIGTNAVVTKDVPANSVYAGIPAKLIKQL